MTTFIDVYVTDRCNYHCRYCYNAAYRESAEMSPEIYPKVTDLINQCPWTPVPNILGGEPMLKKDINRVLDCVRESKAESIELTTNGSILMSKLADFSMLKTIFSWHPGQANLDNFMKNIDYVDKRGNWQLTLNMVNNPSDIRFFIDHIPLDKIHFNLIKMDSNEFDSYLPKYEISGNLLNERIIKKYHLNNFYNKRCFLRWFNIDIHGNLRRGCDNQLTTYQEYVRCGVKYCNGGLPALSSLKSS